MFSSLEYCSRWLSLDSSVLVLLSFSACSLSSRFIAYNICAISCRMGNSSSNFALMKDMALRCSMSSGFVCSVLEAALVFPLSSRNNEQAAVRLYQMMRNSDDYQQQSPPWVAVIFSGHT